MNRVFQLVLLGILFGMNQIALSQEKGVISGSPQASALSKFINFPVGYNTGIPNISVPLHEIKAGNVDLPVNLLYHAGGFKVGEMSTDVGMGWSLSTDLQITRSVKGLDDLSPTGYCYGNISPPSSVEEMINVEDKQPDRFHYSLLSKSGAFYFRRNGNNPPEIVTIPYTGVKVKLINGNCFQITDTDGTVYWFGTRNNPSSLTDIERSLLYNGGAAGESFVTAWKCTAIINPSSKDEITFHYAPKNVQYVYNANERIELLHNPAPCQGNNTVFPYQTGSKIWLHNSINGGYPQQYDSIALNRFASPKYFNYSAGSDAGLHVWWDKYVQNGYYHQYDDQNYTMAPVSSYTQVYGVVLTDIVYRGGKLEFNHIDGGDKLDKIIEYDSANNLIKSSSFFYSNPPATDPTNRAELNFKVCHYLNSVTITNLSNPGDTYSFKYNNKYPFNNYLKGSDSWGGVNSSTRYQNELSVVPMQYIDVDFLDYNCNTDHASVMLGNADIAVDTAMVKSGILTQIIYPTGGSTVFQYGSNKYKDGHGYTHLAGGLRIERISYYDKQRMSPAFEKIYSYGELINGKEDGAGRLMSSWALNTDEGSGYNYTQILKYIMPAGIHQWSMMGEEEKTTYLASSLVDPFYCSGAPVHYTDVAEYKTDKGRMTGKTVYSYDKDPYSGYNPVYLFPNTNIVAEQSTWHLGKLQTETQYKYSGGTYDWVNQKKYEYVTYQQAEEVQVGQLFQKTQYWMYSGDTNLGYFVDRFLCSENDFTYYSYGLPVGTLRTSKVEEKWKENGLELAQTTNYYYDDPTLNEATRIEKTASGNKKETTYIKYPGFYQNTGNFIDSLKANYMISYPVEKVTTLDKGSGEYVIAGSYTAYRQDGTGLPASTHNLEISSPIPVNFFTFSNSNLGFTPSASYKEKKSYQYDLKGNPVRVINNAKSATGYQWGYNNLYPVAECKNATETEFFYDGFEENGTAGIAHTGSNYHGVPYQIPFSIPNGRKYLYSYWYLDGAIWKFSGELVYSGMTQINVGNAIDDVRVYPADAELVTYTYIPLVGIGSITDAKAKTIYYEYDTLNRLKAIRDQDKNLLKTYCYNYAGQSAGCDIPGEITPYSSAIYSASFTKNDCTQGGLGSTVQYSVPAGTYTSIVSQQDADNKAQADAAINGQAYANTFGFCIPAVHVVIQAENDFWTDLNHQYCDQVAHFYDNNYNPVSINGMQLNYYLEWQALYDSNYILSHKNKIVSGTSSLLESAVLEFLNVGNIGWSGWYQYYPEEGEGYK